MKTNQAILIFTDGACSGNPGPGGWSYLMKDPEGVRSIRGFVKATTNNRMEMTACVEALKYISSQINKSSYSEIKIYTDSSYVIKGITEWLPSWKKKNWVKSDGSSVANVDLWQALDELVQVMPTIRWQWVRGHDGQAGNEWVDREAVLAYQEEESQTKVWKWSEFPSKEIFDDLPIKEEPLKKSSSSSKSIVDKASSASVFYVSYVEGKLEKHKTWSDCEKRVKGKSGAKFKKLKSEEELKNLLHSWKIKDLS